MPNVVHELDGSLLVVVHRALPPTTEEWAALVVTARRTDRSRLRQLVFTDGGAPNAAQRKEIPELFDGRTTVSIVSSSTMVLGIATAMAWADKKIKGFTPEETLLAFQHLGIKDAAEIDRAWRVVRGLRVKLGDDSLQSIVG